MLEGEEFADAEKRYTADADGTNDDGVANQPLLSDVQNAITNGKSTGGNTIQNNSLADSIYGISANTTGQDNRYLNNDLTNCGSGNAHFAAFISGDAQFVLSGNDFTDSQSAVPSCSGVSSARSMNSTAAVK